MRFCTRRMIDNTNVRNAVVTQRSVSDIEGCVALSPRSAKSPHEINRICSMISVVAEEGLFDIKQRFEKALFNYVIAI